MMNILTWIVQILLQVQQIHFSRSLVKGLLHQKMNTLHFTRVSMDIVYHVVIMKLVLSTVQPYAKMKL